MSEQGPSGFAVWTVLRRDALSTANAAPATESLADAIAARAAEMEALQPPDHGPSVSFEEEIAGIIRAGGAAVREHLQELFDAAEAIRKIAGDSEQVLYRYRDLAIEIGALYEGIRGAREWQAPQGG